MRIIAGRNRGLRLVTPRGMKTRPTTDRIKETLFNIIGPGIYGCRFLDLFAGSGQIGLEAASRGAEFVLLIDRDKNAAECIRENISATRAGEDQVRFLQSDVFAGFERAEAFGPFDIIFMDPPYDAGLERRLLAGIAQSRGLLADGGQIILEASDAFSAEALFDDVKARELGLACVRQKKYKTNQHLFIEKSERQI